MSDKPAPKRHPGRKIRNYMLNKELQLRFALFIVGVLAILTAVLVAVIVYETNRSTKLFQKQRSGATDTFTRLRSEATEMFARQRASATKIYKEQLKVATDMLDVMKAGAKIKGDKDLEEDVVRTKKLIQERDAKAVQTRKKQDDELKNQRKAQDKQIRAQREKEDKELYKKQRQSKLILITAMVAFSVVFLIVIFLYGIVITHKVAGPLFKISRHFNEVKENRLTKIYGLRKGDQLVEFFNEFKQMHDALKARTEADIRTLQVALAALKASDNAKAKETAAQVEKALEAKKQSIEEPT